MHFPPLLRNEHGAPTGTRAASTAPRPQRHRRSACLPIRGFIHSHRMHRLAWSAGLLQRVPSRPSQPRTRSLRGRQQPGISSRILQRHGRRHHRRHLLARQSKRRLLSNNMSSHQHHPLLQPLLLEQSPRSRPTRPRRLAMHGHRLICLWDQISAARLSSLPPSKSSSRLSHHRPWHHWPVLTRAPRQ